MKVVSYLSVVPTKNSNQQKTELLRRYVEGVQKNGDTGILHTGYQLIPADVAVIQGWVYENKAPVHLKLRNDVIEYQKLRDRYTCAADANLLNYANKQNPLGYLRYSFNGVFPHTGIYCDDNIDVQRWNKISANYKIKIEPTKRKGKWIILMLQRNGGWSMQGEDVQDWALKTIKRIRKYTDRPILIRAHPGDQKAQHYLNERRTRLKNLPGVKISPIGRSLEEDLTKCWAVVNHNSSAVVGPMIQGYHTFITDAGASQCRDAANTELRYIENPLEFDREKWAQRISMFTWNFAELSSGECWSHMKNYCQ